MNNEELDILIANAEYESQPLKDYITNLQHTEDLYNQLLKDYDELQQRIEKAVELLQNDINFGDLCDGYKVLDILNGDNNE